MDIFIDRLIGSIKTKKNPTVVGLDPRLDLIPYNIRNEFLGRELSQKSAAHAILEFNKRIVDLLEAIVPAVKLQIAFYEMFGSSGLETYYRTIEYAKAHDLVVIGDVKRNDIGSTAEAYAMAHLDENEICGVKTGGGAFADAITINPYLGSDGVDPFIKSCKKRGCGVFVLVKTSNPSSSELQDLNVGTDPLFMHVARRVESWGRELKGSFGYSSIGAVTGATFTETIKKIRKAHPSLFLLIPGYGAQGGTKEMIKQAFDRQGLGAIINSSRGIVFAGTLEDPNWQDSVVKAATMMRQDLQEMIGWA